MHHAQRRVDVAPAQLPQQRARVVGEFVYIRDYRGVPIAAPRTMLHARALGFVHPRTGKAMSFESEPPADFRAMLARLRR
jgi:23S rRNA pseudouridine1911/1915/1917 synthase